MSAPTPVNKTTESCLQLLELPGLLQSNIMRYVPYEDISRCREVSQRFNQVAGSFLNAGLFKVEQRHSEWTQKIKAKLPRRESERRNHPLSKLSDILSAIETRLSLLNMTYRKYIENGIACFIPGKVLDELFNVLRVLSTYYNANSTSDTTNLKPHEVLQELRDLSSMAMEHFDEHIVSTLPSRSPYFSSTSRAGLFSCFDPIPADRHGLSGNGPILASSYSKNEPSLLEELLGSTVGDISGGEDQSEHATSSSATSTSRSGVMKPLGISRLAELTVAQIMSSLELKSMRKRIKGADERFAVYKKSQRAIQRNLEGQLAIKARTIQRQGGQILALSQQISELQRKLNETAERLLVLEPVRSQDVARQRSGQGSQGQEESVDDHSHRSVADAGSSEEQSGVGSSAMTGRVLRKRKVAPAGSDQFETMAAKKSTRVKKVKK